MLQVVYDKIVHDVVVDNRGTARGVVTLVGHDRLRRYGGDRQSAHCCGSGNGSNKYFANTHVALPTANAPPATSSPSAVARLLWEKREGNVAAGQYTGTKVGNESNGFGILKETARNVR